MKSSSPLLAAFFSLTLRAASVISSFLVGWIISRLLGVSYAGEVLFTLTCVTVAATISTFGYDTALSKFSAEFKEDGLIGKIKSLLHLCVRKIVLSSFFCAVAFVCYRYLFSVGDISMDVDVLVWAIVIFFVSVLSAALLGIFSYIFQGVGSVGLTVFSQRTIFNFMLSILLGFIWWVDFDLDNSQLLVWSYIAISIASLLSFFVISIFLNRYLLKFKANALSITDKETFYEFSHNAYKIALAQLVSLYAIQFIISIAASMEDMSGYIIAGRIASVLSFFILAVSNVIMPKVAASFYKKDFENIRLQYIRSIVFSSSLGIPMCIFMFAFSEQILELFGEGFSQFQHVLWILLVAQIVNCFTGSSDIVLTYIGGVKEHKINVYLGLFTSILLSVILIPAYGAIGAAVSSLISSVFVNLLDSYKIIKKVF